MRVAIVCTGSVALATAALLARGGHNAILVSVTGDGGKRLSNGSVTATGAMELTFRCKVATNVATTLEAADAIIFATSANRYRAAMDIFLPHVENRHQVLVSGELTQVSTAMGVELARRGVTATITALSTTLATGRRGSDASVRVGIIRRFALACTHPKDREDDAICFWNGVFGNVLTPAPSPLHLTLSNLNPIVHIPNAMCNFTRIEKGEDWSNYGGISDGVARMILALDKERLAVAHAFDIEVAPFKKHYEDSFGFPTEMSLAEMAAELHVRRNGLPKGPTSIDTRYLTEDVPFGIVVLEHLATLRALPTPISSAVITLSSAIYGRALRLENPFLKTLTA